MDYINSLEARSSAFVLIKTKPNNTIPALPPLYHHHNQQGSGEMVEQLRVLLAFPEDLNFVLRTFVR